MFYADKVLWMHKYRYNLTAGVGTTAIVHILAELSVETGKA